MDEWLALIPSRLQFIEAVLRDEGIALDFSADSLALLEEDIQARFEEIDETPSVDGEDIEWAFEGVAAYVGEVLLRRGGGGWRPAGEVEGGRLVPAIEADAALRLPPVSVVALLLEAVRDGGGVLRGAYNTWDRAVAAYQAAHPSWMPVKRPTPGVDAVPETPTEAEVLRRWLTAQRAAFPDWAAGYGAGVTWDFSAPTVDALGVVALRELSTVDDLDAPANAAFVDCAAWYLGETLRRVRGGHWRYRDGDPEFNPWNAQPFVEQPGPDGARAVPRWLLHAVVRQRNTQHLLVWYEAFTGQPD